ncbi:hypothetical protein [Aquabacterium sp.]|uniref:hypothetical protein n=1 Tax=Aquabacterium sp. TaxID=1872578 RepID=UPI0025BD591C|nr:hypothetical protein [Aquabacterium sp.]
MSRWLLALCAFFTLITGSVLSSDGPGHSAWQAVAGEAVAWVDAAARGDVPSEAQGAPDAPDQLGQADTSAHAEGEHEHTAMLPPQPLRTATPTGVSRPCGLSDTTLLAPCLAGLLRPPRA